MSSGRNVTEAHHDKHIRRGRLRAGQARRHDHHKLEKLCYYSQAWSLVWDERRLFPERFEAWANGPVCPDLYHAHKGMFKITRGDIHGDPSNIDEDGTSTIDAVLNAYGKMGAYQLSELTHSERPWRDARGDLPQGAICNTEITEAAMAEYYGSLTD